jgi:hypothetical protein
MYFSLFLKDPAAPFPYVHCVVLCRNNLIAFEDSYACVLAILYVSMYVYVTSFIANTRGNLKQLQPWGILCAMRHAPT